MKKMMLTAMTILTGFFAQAQQTVWKFDQPHTHVKFIATHMVVSEVEGDFKKFDIKVTTNGNDFSNASIEAVIDINSISTDNEMRDKHLKSDDFFNAEKYPTMSFKAKTFTKVDAKNYIMKGDLTIRDVTKPIELKVVYNGQIVDGYGNTRSGFKVTGSVKRLEYGLKWNMMMEAGAVVSNDILIKADVELIKEKSAK